MAKNKIHPKATHTSEWKKHNNKEESRVRNRALRRWGKLLSKGKEE